MDGYGPTNHLRFVERGYRCGGSDESPIFQMHRILQQRWDSAFQGEEPEWRDVPVAST